MTGNESIAAIAWLDNAQGIAASAPFPDPALPDEMIFEETARQFDARLPRACAVGLALNVRLLREHYLTLLGSGR